jgi:hypothetical protein
MKILLCACLAAAAARGCAKEGSVIAKDSGKAVGKSSALANELAISRAAILGSRYLARDMSNDSKFVSYDSTSNTFTISNIK